MIKLKFLYKNSLLVYNPPINIFTLNFLLCNTYLGSQNCMRTKMYLKHFQKENFGSSISQVLVVLGL